MSRYLLHGVTHVLSRVLDAAFPMTPPPVTHPVRLHPDFADLGDVALFHGTQWAQTLADIRELPEVTRG